jgi:carbon-monoxide dehydrogenase small subunit
MEIKISVNVNGKNYVREVEPRTLLVHFLRDTLRLTGTHIGCDTSSCGACTIHVDGVAVKSCTMLAVQADGSSITTIEGLAQGAELHPLQEGFKECHGLQCGFCTPGMIMTAADLLAKNPIQARLKFAMAWRVIFADALAITISLKQCNMLLKRWVLK